LHATSTHKTKKKSNFLQLNHNLCIDSQFKDMGRTKQTQKPTTYTRRSTTHNQEMIVILNGAKKKTTGEAGPAGPLLQADTINHPRKGKVSNKHWSENVLELTMASLTLGGLVTNGRSSQIQEAYVRVARVLREMKFPLSPTSICKLFFDDWQRGYMIISKELAHTPNCYKTDLGIHIADFCPTKHAVVLHLYPELQSFFLRSSGDPMMLSPTVTSIGSPKPSMVCIDWGGRGQGDHAIW
jgi:hypothetical protein